MSDENHIRRIIFRVILACAIAALTASLLIVLFTFDWETIGAGPLVSLFAIPSILLFFISRSSRRWSRYAVASYAVPAFLALLFFFVAALTGAEGRYLARLFGFVLLGTLILMFPVSAMLAVSAPVPKGN